MNDLHVVAGVLLDDVGRVLIAQRPVGKSLAGRWEFPGGKVNQGESPQAALVRELAEELGIQVLVAEPLMVVRHQYPSSDRAVKVDAWRVTRWQGVPQSLDGQALRWHLPAELIHIDILEADRPIITALCVPRRFVKVTDHAHVTEYITAQKSADPVAWVFDSPPQESLCHHIEAARHMYFVISAGSSLRCCIDGSMRWSGYCVSTLDDCLIAIAKGADFLLVQDARLSIHEWHTLGNLGVPWYAEPAQVPSSAQAIGTALWNSTALVNGG